MAADRPRELPPESGRPPECADRQKKLLTKVFFKRLNHQNQNQNLNDANCKEISTVSQRVAEIPPRNKRYSLHQDVEEALSSLLWQPYEYQRIEKEKQHFIEEHQPSPLLCSASSSNSSLSSEDVLESSSSSSLWTNGPADRLQCNVAYSSECPSEELFSLVNNLPQCCCGPESGDLQESSASRDAALLLLSKKRGTGTYLLSTGRAAVAGGPRHLCGGNESSAEMLQPEQTLPPPPRSTRNVNRLVGNANVVGLPHQHPRQASVPVASKSTTIRHTRNISEPFVAARPTTTSVASGNNIRLPIDSQANGNAANNNGVQRDSYPVRNTAEAQQRLPSLNVSNVNVNYYRAVPVNVVSSVPMIQCTNGALNNNGNPSVPNVNNNNMNVQITSSSTNLLSDVSNVSNVNILPLNSLANTTTTEVIVHNVPNLVQNDNHQHQQQQQLSERTFTSTEAQTDDTQSAAIPEVSREQRRRERRERRHQRRLNNHRHHNGTAPPPPIVSSNVEQTTTSFESTTANNTNNASSDRRLPDLLNNTLPPPYVNSSGAVGHMQLGAQVVLPAPGGLLVPPGAVVQNLVPSGLVANPAGMVPFHQVVPPPGPVVQGATTAIQTPTGFRFPFPANGFRRSRYSEEPPKSCCGLLACRRPGSLRWFIALIALVAVCCVLVGTALGAMRPSGRDHLTVSLLMIGVGIILVTVSGVAWRLTSHDSSTCRSMLGLGSTESVETCRRFVPRLPPSYGRPHHPYAAMMYPEFQFRPPPPSYQASMQEYRLRLLLLDRGGSPHLQAGLQNAVSPPPTYRSHSGSLLRAPLSNRRDASQSEYSCPPSYRSQNSSSRAAAAAAILQHHNNSIMHSREQSLSESNQGGESGVVNIVNILSSADNDIALDNITLDSLKLEPEEISPVKMLLKGADELEGMKDGNLVTIVQTNDQSPVIVTVSGSSHIDANSNTVQITEIPNEMEILAHL